MLDGRKRWIGNATIADVVIVWARDEDGHVGGYLVEKGTPGFDATVMTGKTALRAVWQADIELDGVRVPAENKLPGCRNFRDVAGVLSRTRYTVAWRALGMALGAYEAALAYAKQREQFGKPIASYQLVQDKLSRMLAEITAMQLLCLRLSELADDGRLTAGMASLAKMNHAAKAREIVGMARDILGGNGILLENHVARQHADMEAIFTFEGTDSIQSLIVAREITGLNAILRERGQARDGLAEDQRVHLVRALVRVAPTRGCWRGAGPGYSSVIPLAPSTERALCATSIAACTLWYLPNETCSVRSVPASFSRPRCIASIVDWPTLTAISTSLACVSWKPAIGLSNCTRVFA